MRQLLARWKRQLERAQLPAAAREAAAVGAAVAFLPESCHRWQRLARLFPRQLS